MSASSLEHIAEDLISHALQRKNVLVAKPKFDHNGADLLAFLDVSDGAKFCRIQCKGRSLLQTPKSHIEIASDYATDGLVVILFIEDGSPVEESLYCFFGKEIRLWNKTNNHKYRLSFTKKSHRKKLYPYRFSPKKINEVIKCIIDVNVSGEFKHMEHGYAEFVLPPISFEGKMS
ncbi:hypothetical protein [uncultured Porticoccus sp.]|uniref:hypothetical protein n=1 Tax=uncultured Porticoccus sp. TaxID=1256050 RepID=UPI00260F4F4D|nr:hypothetical protein [uncultured Porticoccus sp.]